MKATRILTLFLSLVLMLGCFAVFATTASAATTYEYEMRAFIDQPSRITYRAYAKFIGTKGSSAFVEFDSYVYGTKVITATLTSKVDLGEIHTVQLYYDSKDFCSVEWVEFTDPYSGTRYYDGIKTTGGWYYFKPKSLTIYNCAEGSFYCTADLPSSPVGSVFGEGSALVIVGVSVALVAAAVVTTVVVVKKKKKPAVADENE